MGMGICMNFCETIEIYEALQRYGARLQRSALRSQEVMSLCLYEEVDYGSVAA